MPFVIEKNIEQKQLRCRLRRGWSVEKALTTELSRKGKRYV